MAEEQQCVFCHIASGKIPAKKIFEDDKVVAVLDINPAVVGHVLILPKEHAAIMPQMSDELVGHMGMIAKQISQSMIRGLGAQGTSIFAANGMAAGQRAPHVLLHVIPREQNDSIQLQLPIIKIDEKTMAEQAQKLLASVAKQFGIEMPKESREEKKIETKQVENKKERKEEKKEESKEKAKEEPKKSEAKQSKSNLDDITNFLAGGK